MMSDVEDFLHNSNQKLQDAHVDARLRIHSLHESTANIVLHVPLHEREKLDNIDSLVPDTFQSFQAAGWSKDYRDYGLLFREYTSGETPSKQNFKALIAMVELASARLPSNESTVGTKTSAPARATPNVTSAAAPIEADLKGLTEFLSQFAISVDGDFIEKDFFSSRWGKNFRAYEKVWRTLVVPATNRIKLFPNPCGDISIRSGVAEKVITMCQFHYSVIRSLRLAGQKVDKPSLPYDGGTSEFFMHMENAFEQAELFLLFWLRIFCYRPSTALRKINLGDPLLKERDSRKKILFSELQFKSYRDLHSIHRQNQHVRDALVHGPELMRLATKDGEWIPSIARLANKDVRTSPQYWRNAESRDIFDDYAPEAKLRESHFRTSVEKFENLWSELAADLEHLTKQRRFWALYGVNIPR